MLSHVGKTAFVDLTRRETRVVDTPRAAVRALLGGRGVNVGYLLRYMRRDTDPLGPENVLIFGAGLLTGYPVPNASRMSISARSPESYALGDSNMGGHFPVQMRKSGLDRIVIVGRASNPVLLYVSEGYVEIKDASDYWGLGVSACQEALARDFGRHVRSAVIGPAGENLVRFAAVMNGRKNAAGRGGMGAVMGSKNLKAVVAAGDGELEIADRDSLLGLRSRLTQYLRESKVIQAYGKLGTALLYEPANRLAALRTKNSQLNQWRDSLDAAHLEREVERMTACSGCVVHCRHVNKYGGEGPDFSTTGLLGANCCVDDIVELIKLNNLCNELGLDTSSTGTLIAWAMELYERGIIDDSVTGGPLVWGDVDRMQRLIADIASRRGFGSILAESTQALRLGLLPPQAEDYLIAVKGLPQSDPHDPRYIKSFALGVAVSSRGADHLRNRPTLDILPLPDHVRSSVYGEETVSDPTAYETKEIVVEFSETIFAVCDALGLCRFVCRGWNSPKLLGYEHFGELIRAAIGLELTEQELREVGRRIVDIERTLNVRLGLTRADDTLPRRYFEDPFPMGPSAGHRIDRDKFDQLLTRYYARRGWNEQGQPPESRKQELKSLLQEFSIPFAESVADDGLAD